MQQRKLINVPIILKILGILLMIESFFMLWALPFSWIYGSARITDWMAHYGNHDFWPILVSALITFLTGSVLYLSNNQSIRDTIGKREGYVVVAITWVVISLFGSLPFLLSGAIPHFTDAFFETMSGFTTTGATILTDVEKLPRGLLFWRSTTHWIGGMGIIVLSLAILPFLGIGGMQLFIAEVPGVTRDKLHPRITETAKRLWGIYFLLTLILILLLLAGGLSLFDSITHAFATMATGGFSTRNHSIAAFSPYVQYVIVVFMFFAGVNFTLHYLALHGRVREVIRNEEFKYYALTILTATLIITVFLALSRHYELEKSFRYALFTVVSINTTTGFVVDNYLEWPGALWFIIFMLMFVGGSAGSTGGGVKVIRHLLLFKNSVLEMKRLLHPQAVIPVRLNGRPVSQDIIFRVLAFFLIYLIVFLSGTFILSIFGVDFQTAIGATISALGNIGPGIGKVGPVDNFSFLPVGAKWVLSILMMMGRLELFTVLILFSKSFWEK